MRSAAAARRYARALFSLARDEHRIDEVRSELGVLEQLVAENPSLRRVLLTPLHPSKERKAALREIGAAAQLSPVVQQFTCFLIDQRRLLDFETIAEEFGRLADEEAGRTGARVVTATPLDADQERRLREALSRRTGRDVELDITVDPDLIGGIVASVGDIVFDGSLRTQLGQLRANLTKGS